MSLRDFCYCYLGWLGIPLANLFKSIEKDLDVSFIQIHPEVYFSIIGLASIIGLVIGGGIAAGFSWLIHLPIQMMPPLVFIGAIGGAIAPIGVGILYPKMMASNRLDSLKVEIPYASMFISVMTSGGLSPFDSFMRLNKMDMLPEIKKEVNRIETIIYSTGSDPLSALELAAREVDVKEYKELLLGYALSVRTGGDTLHYLFSQTHSMFNSLASRIKSVADNMGLIMEAYIILSVLGVLGIFLIFVIGLALPQSGMNISSSTFFLFSFIIMPAMSGLFIFVGDTGQINYPVSDWRPYYVLFGVFPFVLGFMSQAVLPFFRPQLLYVPFIRDLIISIRIMAGFAEGAEPAIGLSLSLILLSIPVAILDFMSSSSNSGLQSGVITFLRDLVESRKSGLSPEKCINALCQRDYKQFTEHLQNINLKIKLGYPIKTIYEEMKEDIKDWHVRLNIYLLIDSMEIGGGSEESLEALAEFAETTQRLEKEKRSVLLPLVIVPYIGALILAGTLVMFLSFFSNSAGMGISVPITELYKTLLTPISLHVFNLGLVTGKISTGRVSAGFKHSILMVLVSLVAVWMIAQIGGGPIFG